MAVAVLEAKSENLPPGHGLEQAKSYGRCKRLNVPFVFYKQAAWLLGLPTPAANTLEAIVGQFGKAGTDGLESPDIFNIPEVRRAAAARQPPRTLCGRGDVLAATYRSQPNLDVVADPVAGNPNHANVTGWPSADDETAQVMIAKEIAAVARFVLPPELGP